MFKKVQFIESCLTRFNSLSHSFQKKKFQFFESFFFFEKSFIFWVFFWEKIEWHSKNGFDSLCRIQKKGFDSLNRIQNLWVIWKKSSVLWVVFFDLYLWEKFNCLSRFIFFFKVSIFSSSILWVIFKKMVQFFESISKKKSSILWVSKVQFFK